MSYDGPRRSRTRPLALPRRTILETDTGADVTAQAGTLYLRGAWTTQHLGGLIDKIGTDKIGALIADDPRNGDPLHVEAGGLTALDTAGAWVLYGLLRGLEHAAARRGSTDSRTGTGRSWTSSGTAPPL